MPHVSEVELAREATETIERFRRLTNGRTRLASALLLGVAIDEAASQGLPETVMTERVFIEFRRRDKVSIDE